MSRFAERFGLEHERSVSEKVMIVVNGIVHLILSSRPAIVIWDLLVGLLLAWIITMSLRQVTASTIIDVIYIVGFTVLFIVIGFVLMKTQIFQKLQRALYGKPTFGELGGLQRKTFFTILRCSRLMKYVFSDEHEATMKAHNTFDAQLTERGFESNYMKVVEYEVANGRPAPAEDWKTVWSGMLQVGDGVSTFKDFLDVNNHASRILPLRLIVLDAQVGALTKLFQVFMLYLIALYALGDLQLVTTINVGLLVIFILSLYVFVSFSVQMTEITLIGIVGAVSDEVREQFKSAEQNLAGQKVIAKRIIIEKGFLSEISRYIQRTVCVSFFNTMVILVLFACALLVHWIFFRSQVDMVADFYLRLAVGLAIVPIALAAGFRCFFWILQNAGVILAPIVYALLAAILPMGIKYLVTGNLDFSETTNIVMTSVAGLGTLVATTIALQASKRLEASKG